MHAIITLEGYIIAFEITSASVDDRSGLRDIVKRRSGIMLLANKGHVSEAFARKLLEAGNLFHGTQTIKQSS